MDEGTTMKVVFLASFFAAAVLVVSTGTSQATVSSISHDTDVLLAEFVVAGANGILLTQNVQQRLAGHRSMKWGVLGVALGVTGFLVGSRDSAEAPPLNRFVGVLGVLGGAFRILPDPNPGTGVHRSRSRSFAWSGTGAYFVMRF